MFVKNPLFQMGDKNLSFILEQEFDSLKVENTNVQKRPCGISPDLLFKIHLVFASENVSQSAGSAAGSPKHHRGDLQSHHVGEREGRGGACVRLGRQEH